MLVQNVLLAGFLKSNLQRNKFKIPTREVKGLLLLCFTPSKIARRNEEHMFSVQLPPPPPPPPPSQTYFFLINIYLVTGFYKLETPLETTMYVRVEPLVTSVRLQRNLEKFSKLLFRFPT
jgi:hypothetical protein